MTGHPPTVPVLIAALSVAALATAGCAPPSVGAESDLPAIEFGTEEWEHWGDGLAEVATYDLTFPRYGSERRGLAVAIFVTEPFSESIRVKAESAARPDGDVFQAMKLNLVRDFPTGVYDYNTMLTALVGLEPSGGRPAGAPAKVSYSSQEWCGHVYGQVTFDTDAVRQSAHSYFDGEADIDGTLLRPAGGVSEDTVLMWARGLASPTLAPGEARDVPMLVSLQEVRLRHRPLAWITATLAREAKPVRVEVPAGTFEADRFSVALDDGRRWTIDVERARPHRILRWTTSDGEDARLVASERMAYWKLNGPDGGGEALRRLGLAPRPPRAP